MRKTFRAAALATAVASALLMAGCSAGGSTDSGPVTITYWGWVPNMDKVVDVWNDENPDIQVNYVKTDAGDAIVTKLLTAITAGSGAPDLVQTEYQAIPTLVSSDALADISGVIGDDVEGKFSDGVWSAVTLGGDAVYAIPQDSGPMMFFYRKDIFDRLGLSAPTTWDEYAAAAEAVHADNPNAYLGTFSSGDAGQFAGLTQQAGASWWGIDGDTWSVDFDSPEVTKVADFWGGLVEDGVIDVQKQFTPEWNAALADGSQVGWVSAVWAPGVLAGNAPDTKGLWAAAPMPQWDASSPANGNWGGSGVAVTSQSTNVEAAVKFNTWLETDPEAVKLLVEQGALYPATSESAEALSAAPDFFSDQTDFYDIAAEAGASVQPFIYGPNVNVAYSAFNDEFGKAVQTKTKAAFLSAVENVQTTTIDDLKKAGFTVR